MSNKIIFLDVDGVLNYSHYTNTDTNDIDPSKVDMLSELCRKTNAKVVITSSWRGSDTYTPRIYGILRDILAKHNIPVLGDAPYIKLEFDNERPNHKHSYTIKFGTGRGAEVMQYIMDNRIEKYVIFDDEDWDWDAYGIDDHWCQCVYHSEHQGGLQQKHIEKAIQLLS